MAAVGAVNHALNQLPGADCSSLKGGTTPNGITAQMDKCAVDVALICNVAEKLSLQNTPAANEPVMASGPSFIGTALGAAALALAPAGPVVAGIGVIAAANDAFRFGTQHLGTKHAAVHGTQGEELTIAANDETYTDVSGDIYNWTGQAVKPQQPTPAAGRASPLDIAAARTREEYTPEEIARDVTGQLRKKQSEHALAANKLDVLTGGETRARDQKLGWDPDVLADMNPDKPRPKALDVGMKGTGLSYAAPVAPSVPTFG